MRRIIIALPYPPSINHYYVRTKRGMMIGKKGEQYRRDVAYLLLESRNVPLQGNLSISIKTCPPDNRIRDIDNILKALLDALQHGGAYENDNQISKLSIERGNVVKHGAVHVDIIEIEEA